ncbi:MAG TPA: PQ-loop domain-containing transporter [Candidatus Bathyarchaeia archaeon]|nr:PQ-loop domain-containing transporter [Candidatus Bathyarchaeia archaeon]
MNMSIPEIIINSIFSLGLFINGSLFVPQAIKIIKLKSAKDLSLTTFIGFLATQLAAILYGFIHWDLILLYGYLYGVVSALIFIYPGLKQAR